LTEIGADAKVEARAWLPPTIAIPMGDRVDPVVVMPINCASYFE